MAGKHIKKLVKKGELEKAAAVLGGLLRDPEVRPLLAAAGIHLSEDVTMDSTLIDNMADLIAQMGTGRGSRSYQARGVDTVLTGLVNGTSPVRYLGYRARSTGREHVWWFRLDKWVLKGLPERVVTVSGIGGRPVGWKVALQA